MIFTTAPRRDEETGVGVAWPDARKVGPAPEHNEYRVDDDEDDAGTARSDVVDRPRVGEQIVQARQRKRRAQTATQSLRTGRLDTRRHLLKPQTQEPQTVPDGAEIAQIYSAGLRRCPVDLSLFRLSSSVCGFR